MEHYLNVSVIIYSFQKIGKLCIHAPMRTTCKGIEASVGRSKLLFYTLAEGILISVRSLQRSE